MKPSLQSQGSYFQQHMKNKRKRTRNLPGIYTLTHAPTNSNLEKITAGWQKIHAALPPPLPAPTFQPWSRYSGTQGMYDSWHINQNNFCLTTRSSMPPVNHDISSPFCRSLLFRAQFPMRVVPQIRRQNNNWLRSSTVSYSMLHNRKRL